MMSRQGTHLNTGGLVFLHDVAGLVDVDDEPQGGGGAGGTQQGRPQRVAAGQRPVGHVKQLVAVHHNVVVDAKLKDPIDARGCVFQDLLSDGRKVKGGFFGVFFVGIVDFFFLSEELHYFLFSDYYFFFWGGGLVY